MRAGIKAGLVLGGFAVITAGIIGYVVWHAQQKPNQVAVKGESSVAQAIPLDSDQSGSSLSVSGNSGLGGGIEGNTDQSGGSASSSKSSVPGPETFVQFDKYKGEKNALYQDIQPGTGDGIKVNKKAAVIYKVYLTDGKLIDQNRVDKDNKIVPFVFTYGAHQVIPGWEQGFGGMKVGGVRRLIIPPAVGYGSKGQDPVPPNAVLVIDVQLLEIEK
jgi:hypothetical protein